MKHRGPRKLGLGGRDWLAAAGGESVAGGWGRVRSEAGVPGR